MLFLNFLYLSLQKAAGSSQHARPFSQSPTPYADTAPAFSWAVPLLYGDNKVLQDISWTRNYILLRELEAEGRKQKTQASTNFEEKVNAGQAEVPSALLLRPSSEQGFEG